MNYKIILLIIIIGICLFFIYKFFNKTEKYDSSSTSQSPNTNNESPNTNNESLNTNNPEVTCDTVEDCEKKLTQMCGEIKGVGVPNIKDHEDYDKLCWIDKFKTDRPAYLHSRYMKNPTNCSTLIRNLEQNEELLNKIKEKNPCTNEVGGATSSTSLPPTAESTLLPKCPKLSIDLTGDWFSWVKTSNGDYKNYNPSPLKVTQEGCTISLDNSGDIYDIIDSNTFKDRYDQITIKVKDGELTTNNGFKYSKNPPL
jgi:hypothetical protein